MFNIRDLFEAIVGGGAAQQSPQPNRDGGRSRNPMQLTKQGGQGLESLMFANQPRRQYEDEGFVGNPRSMNQFSPMNADVRSFPGVNPDFGLRMQGGLRGIQNPGAINPMGFTGGQGFRPQYNQEALSNMQGGAPNFNSYGMQYPEGTRNDRLRVR